MVEFSWDNSRRDRNRLLALASLLRLRPDQVQIETEKSTIEDVEDVDKESAATLTS